MMRKVKYALAFLAGALYASSWWFIGTMFVPDNAWMIIPLAIAGFGSIGILMAVLFALTDHWNDDKG